jgi:hypothetical protein
VVAGPSRALPAAPLALGRGDSAVRRPAGLASHRTGNNPGYHGGLIHTLLTTLLCL